MGIDHVHPFKKSCSFELSKKNQSKTPLFRVENPRLQLSAAAPAASCDAHATLGRAWPHPLAVSPLQPLALHPLAVRLALRALWPASGGGGSGGGAGGGLGRDGAQQVFPLAQEVAVGA